MMIDDVSTYSGRYPGPYAPRLTVRDTIRASRSPSPDVRRAMVPPAPPPAPPDAWPFVRRIVGVARTMLGFR
jgi:hypothetical protein